MLAISAYGCSTFFDAWCSVSDLARTRNRFSGTSWYRSMELRIDAALPLAALVSAVAFLSTNCAASRFLSARANTIAAISAASVHSAIVCLRSVAACRDLDAFRAALGPSMAFNLAFSEIIMRANDE